MYTKIAMAVIAPGYGALQRRRVLGLVLGAVGVIVPVALVMVVVLTGRNVLSLGLDSGFLAVIVFVGAGALFARLVALAELWLAAGRPTRLRPVDALAFVAAVAVLSAGSVAVARVEQARRAVEPVFVSTSGVLFDAERTGEPADDTPPTSTSRPPSSTAAPTTQPAASPTVVDGAEVPTFTTDRRAATPATSASTLPPPLPTRPDSGVDGTLLTEVSTVLLLGGDAGPGRSGLRTDSMMLFSVHRPSGRAALVSIPRDMRRLLFPPASALEARHPYGYSGLTNAVFPIVSSSRPLREAYAVEGVGPGVVALAQGIGYSLDVTIDDYVLVDMQGFLDLIDALGGVTLTLETSIPMPGNVPGARTQYPDRIGPGVVTMDGSTALGYARSRKGDNDYRRARRQRGLLAALARQVSVTDVARSFSDVAAAVGGTLRTSLTPEELVDTLNVIGGETAIVESVGLVPPLVDVRRPDFPAIARIVGAVRLALVTGRPSGY